MDMDDLTELDSTALDVEISVVTSTLFYSYFSKFAYVILFLKYSNLSLL